MVTDRLEHITIPHYLNEKNNVVRLVVLTAVFALLFINIYQPFNSREWVEGLSDLKYFLFSNIVILIGMCDVAISRIIMYHYAKKHALSLLQYILWVFVEILIMALIFASIQVFILKIGFFSSALEQAFINTSLILLMPYTLLWLYFGIRDKTKTINSIRQAENNRISASGTGKNNLICFYDEKGSIRFSVDCKNLYYIESADNYVKIYYLNKGKLQHFMMRSSLKLIDELFGEKELIRCHRSYMVNFDKVKVLRKTEEGLFLDLDNELVPEIPVSKTYNERVMNHFINHTK